MAREAATFRLAFCAAPVDMRAGCWASSAVRVSMNTSVRVPCGYFAAIFGTSAGRNEVLTTDGRRPKPEHSDTRDPLRFERRRPQRAVDASMRKRPPLTVHGFSVHLLLGTRRHSKVFYVVRFVQDRNLPKSRKASSRGPAGSTLSRIVGRRKTRRTAISVSDYPDLCYRFCSVIRDTTGARLADFALLRELSI